MWPRARYVHKYELKIMSHYSMEECKLCGGIAPLIFKLGSRHVIVQTVCPGHFTATEIAWVVRWVGAGADLDILKKW